MSVHEVPAASGMVGQHTQGARVGADGPRQLKHRNVQFAGGSGEPRSLQSGNGLPDVRIASQTLHEQAHLVAGKPPLVA